MAITQFAGFYNAASFAYGINKTTPALLVVNGPNTTSGAQALTLAFGYTQTSDGIVFQSTEHECSNYRGWQLGNRDSNAERGIHFNANDLLEHQRYRNLRESSWIRRSSTLRYLRASGSDQLRRVEGWRNRSH